MLTYLQDALANPFMVRALVQLLLLAVLGGVVGTHVVLRRLAYVTDALHHTVFPGIVIAYLLYVDLLLGALAAAALTVVVLAFTGEHRRLDRNGVMALSVSFAFALGVVLVSRSSSYQHDLTVLLFGRILSVSVQDIVETVVITVLTLAVMLALHKELVMAAFDPVGAATAGYSQRAMDLLLHSLVALVVVASVRSVGTVLVVAFLVTPAAAARLVSRSVASMMVIAVLISALCGVVGLGISYDLSVNHHVNLASGATVVVAMTAAFLVLGGVRVISRRARRTQREGSWRGGKGPDLPRPPVCEKTGSKAGGTA